MRKRKGNSGIIVLLMIFMLLTGFVAGMILVHILDEKNMKADEKIVEEIPEEEDESEKAINVYFPKRNIKYGEVPRNSYNPENFTIEEGYMAYYNEDGEKISHVGVDLSYHNTDVDWEALAASPIEFVMLRCGYRGYTEGGLVEDERFREYAKAANEHGLALGVYFFTQALTEQEAIAEAEFTLKMIEDYDISYPVALDTELVNDDDARTNQTELSREELTNICKVYCERIREAGYYPMIYASENWFRRKLNVHDLKDYDFWAPQYLDENDFLYDFTIWQYTESGSAPGVSGEVDLDISMVDYASFVPALREAIRTDGEIGEYDGNPDNNSFDVPDITISPIDSEE